MTNTAPCAIYPNDATFKTIVLGECPNCGTFDCWLHYLRWEVSAGVKLNERDHHLVRAFDRATAQRVRDEARADIRGFDGRFFFDEERGDLAFIARACDEDRCDCEVKVNADGDQDCSVSVFEIDDVGGVIARMLNRHAALADQIDASLSELRRWENCGLCIDCGRCAFDEDGCCVTCGQDVLGFIDGKLVARGMADYFDGVERNHGRLRAQLDSMTKAVAGLAESVARAKRHREQHDRGGQQVPFHGDFANASPSVLIALERWLRDLGDLAKVPTGSDV